MLPVEAKRNFWSALRWREQVGGAVDVDRLGELGLFLAGRVADDRRQVNDRVDPVQGRLGGRGVADVALLQLEEAIGAAGQEAMAAELERVEDSNAMPQLQQHGNQGRANVTGSAGDENSHRRLHPWWLETRLERRGCRKETARGKARRADRTPQALVLAALIPLCLLGGQAIPSLQADPAAAT